VKSHAEARHILDKLEAQHPDADTELRYRNPYELLVATILSAQSTDQRVNMVTPRLFAAYPDAAALARADPRVLERYIHSTGFFRAKARALIGMAKALVAEHGGEVPASLEALTKLPGVGRKTANVVLGHAFGVPGLAVDRHVLRVANRIGLATSDDPEVVERQLCAALPPDRWTRASDTLILHGRRVCRPKPLCDRCAVQADCEYFHAVIARQPAAAPGGASRGRRRAQSPGARRARAAQRAPAVKASPPADGAAAAPRRRTAAARAASPAAGRTGSPSQGRARRR
jgi:endonuclease-3